MRFYVEFMFWLGAVALVLRIHRLAGEFPTKGESKDVYVLATLIQLALFAWTGLVLLGNR